MSPFFSVIIPALNEELYLPKLLDSLVEQTFKDFEVILVDAESTDKTVKEAKKYHKLDLTIITNKKRNISSSRNIGAAKAKAPYLVFIDADNYFHPTFFERMKDIILKGNEMIIPEIMPDSKKIYYKSLYESANIFIRLAKLVKHPYSTGGNFVIKKETFQKLNGFDESIFVSEDHDIVKRANREGVKIAISDNPKVIFSVRRFEKEGVKVLGKYLVSTIHVAFFGKITKRIYGYQMGGDYYKKNG